jgi:hypothetical protein
MAQEQPPAPAPAPKRNTSKLLDTLQLILAVSLLAFSAFAMAHHFGYTENLFPVADDMGGFGADDGETWKSEEFDEEPPPEVVESKEATTSKFNVKVNVKAIVQRILSRYPNKFALFREMIQNSNDAKATMVKFDFQRKCTQMKHSGPCLVIQDNGNGFEEPGWERLTTIASGNPDPGAVGGFGVGFYSVFHVSQEPVVRSRGTQVRFYWSGDKLACQRIDSKDPKGKKIKGAMMILPMDDFSTVDEEFNNERFLEFIVRSLSFTENVVKLQVRGLTKSPDFLASKVMSKMHLESPPLAVRQSPNGIFNLIQHVKRTDIVVSCEFFKRTGIVSGSLISSANSTANFTLYTSDAECDHHGKDTEFTRAVFSKTGKKSLPKTVTVKLLMPAISDTADDNNDPAANAADACSGSDLTKFVGCALSSTRSHTEGSFRGFKGGNVFVGFETSQSTGTTYHISAPFFATMDRESLELGDKAAIAIFNGDLLWIGGTIARHMYDHALNVALPTPLPADNNGISAADSALEAVLQRFFIRVSYPNKYVSMHLSDGFFSKGHADLQVPCIIRRPAAIKKDAISMSGGPQKREPPFFSFWSKTDVFIATRMDGKKREQAKRSHARILKDTPQKDIGVHKMHSGERLTALCSAETARIPPEMNLKASVTSSTNQGSGSHSTKLNGVTASFFFLADPVQTLPSWVADKCRPFVMTLRRNKMLRRLTAPEMARSIRQFQPMHQKFAANFVAWLRMAYESNKVPLLSAPAVQQILSSITVCATTRGCTPQPLGTVTHYAPKRYAQLPVPFYTLPADLSTHLDDIQTKRFLESILGLEPIEFSDWWALASANVSAIAERHGFSASFLRLLSVQLAPKLDKLFSQEASKVAHGKGAHDLLIDHTNAPLEWQVVQAMRRIPCIPTAQGTLTNPMKVYMPDVSPELPLARIHPQLMSEYLVSDRFLRILGVRSRLHIDSLIGKVVITPETSVQILETVVGIQSKLAFDEWRYLKDAAFALDETEVVAGCTTNVSEALAQKKKRCTLYSPSQLYLPHEDMRNLGLPVIYFPVKGGLFSLGSKSPLSETAKAMFLRMGVRMKPSLDHLVDMIAGGHETASSSTTCAVKDQSCTAVTEGEVTLTKQAEQALLYLAKNIRSLYEGMHIPGHAKFLPTDQGTIKIFTLVHPLVRVCVSACRCVGVSV